MRRIFSATAVLAPLTLVLAACSQGAPVPEAEETDIPDELQQAAKPEAPVAVDTGATPMADRVATIGLLNKRNNLSQDLEMKPGESRRLGNVIIRLSACERTPPWELPKETGAFVQVMVRDTGGARDWRKVFSGWLFKQSPSLNVVEHPIYDVWVKDCAMNFPGETSGADPDDADDKDAAKPSAAAPAAPAEPAPAPDDAAANNAA